MLATPEYGRLCDGKGSGTDTSSVMSTDDLATVCSDSGFVRITDEWESTFIAKEGTYTLPDGTAYEGLVAVDITAKAYDAHYLIGNYYQGKTVIAGGPSEITGEYNSAASICPKGWKLPTAERGSFNSNTRGSFAYLMKQYDLAQSDTTGIISNETYNISKNPLYIVRSGVANGYAGYLTGLGKRFALYSGTVINTALTRALNYDYVDGVWFLNSSARSYNNSGMPVRCIAK